MRFAFPLYIFRYSSDHFSALKELAFHLNGKTEYVRMAPLEDLPDKADCLTIVYHLFMQAFKTQIPLQLIGNMPRTLASLKNWEFCCVNQEELRCGDLIFVARIKDLTLVGHVAIFLSPTEVFHCKGDHGAIIETYEAFTQTYRQKLTEKQLRYIDPRDREMRQQYRGKYIPESEVILSRDELHPESGLAASSST